MKKFFHKRWCGIPVGIITGILLVCLLAGSVFAAYLVTTHTAQVTIAEAIETVEIWSIDGVTIYPGEMLTKGGFEQIGIVNKSSAELPLIVEWKLYDSVTGASISPDVIDSAAMLIHPAAVLEGETELSVLGAFNSQKQLYFGEDGAGMYGEFTIGTVEYTATDAWDTTIGEDSNMAWVFINGKLRTDVEPITIDIVMSVSRN